MTFTRNMVGFKKVAYRKQKKLTIVLQRKLLLFLYANFFSHTYCIYLRICTDDSEYCRNVFALKRVVIFIKFTTNCLLDHLVINIFVFFKHQAQQVHHRHNPEEEGLVMRNRFPQGEYCSTFSIIFIKEI